MATLNYTSSKHNYKCQRTWLFKPSKQNKTSCILIDEISWNICPNHIVAIALKCSGRKHKKHGFRCEHYWQLVVFIVAICNRKKHFKS